ncbi:hypothetical protein E1A91_A02G001700v1 [Gossypium mustelinum]|uniref:Uncharacterized protein n=1 Tax=Gossypium mustelinum TaxID=34275 RepID=A0A5D3A3W3_GOSMU|nr:hypothetical protein E1A91_A02G001700v1 [Gossypium mustelinum]
MASSNIVSNVSGTGLCSWDNLPKLKRPYQIARAHIICTVPLQVTHFNMLWCMHSHICEFE